MSKYNCYYGTEEWDNKWDDKCDNRWHDKCDNRWHDKCDNRWCPPNWCHCCHWEHCCKHEPHKPERPKKESAQFVGDIGGIPGAGQRVTVPTDTAVKIAPTRIFDGREIKLEGDSGVRLERGRYEVDYYLTITNNEPTDPDNADTFVARLRLVAPTTVEIPYTRSSVRISAVNVGLNVGFLTKPNIVEVSQTSILQLVVNVTDLTANYTITDASIKVVKID